MIGEFLTERVTIQRAPAATVAADGSADRAFASTATNVPASIQARSGTYRQGEIGLTSESAFAGYFSATTDIRRGDRVVHGTSIYDVTFVTTRHANHTEADLALVAVL